MMAFRVRVRGSFHCVIYRSKRETFIPRIVHAHTEVDMNIDESDTENIVLQQEIQKALAEASALETAELRKLVEKQNNEMKVQSRKIEALHTLSQENVRNPSYS
jgi:hypothetical protein